MNSEDDTEEESRKTGEPQKMSWFVFGFMLTCIFMTAVMAYYAWDVFERSV